MRPEVTVVVPLYNKGPFINRALESILAQTFGDFELIVVDDGSTDEGPDVVRTSTDSRVRLVHQKNAGPGAARNTGIAHANAGILAFLDADDEWLPDYLEHAVLALRASPTAAAHTCAYVDCPGERSSTPMWIKRGIHDGLTRITERTTVQQLVFSLAFMTPCTTVTRRRVLERFGGFHSADGCRYAEDAALWLKVLLNEAVSFDLAPRVRLHNDASSLSKNLKGARPIEPFLRDPADVDSACPEHLRPLLNRFYAARAFKTACVWGCAGEWRKARELRACFAAAGPRIPFYWSSLLCSTPAGRLIGTAVSRWRLR